MTDAWFSMQAAPWFSFLSLLSLCALFGIWAKKGRHRALVLSIWNVAVSVGALFLVGALVAVITGQPAYVSRTLALAGGVVGFCFVVTHRNMRRLYTEAELRKTVATDL